MALINPYFHFNGNAEEAFADKHGVQWRVVFTQTLAIIALMLFTSGIYAQEVKEAFDGHKWEAPYSLPIPQNWTIERFMIPISFAPQIPYKGVEDIRFAPGWGKSASDEYWSYAFLWFLEGQTKIDSKIAGENLKAYYTGLVGINGRNIPKEKLIPVVTSLKETATIKGDLNTYVGTITMTDYMTQNPLVLNCKVHVKSCPGQNRTFVFHELSPQPFSHKIWEELDKLWLEFKCERK